MGYYMLKLATLGLGTLTTLANPIRWWFWLDGCFAEMHNFDQDRRLDELEVEGTEVTHALATEEARATEQVAIDEEQNNRIGGLEGTVDAIEEQLYATPTTTSTETATPTTIYTLTPTTTSTATPPATSTPTATSTVTATVTATPTIPATPTPEAPLIIVCELNNSADTENVVYAERADGGLLIDDPNNVYFANRGNRELADIGSCLVPTGYMPEWTKIFENGTVRAQRDASEDPFGVIPGVDKLLTDLNPNGDVNRLEIEARTRGPMEYVGTFLDEANEVEVDVYEARFDIFARGHRDNIELGGVVRAILEGDSSPAQSASFKIY